jgi:hypothetical protein
MFEKYDDIYRIYSVNKKTANRRPQPIGVPVPWLRFWRLSERSKLPARLILGKTPEKRAG